MGKTNYQESIVLNALPSLYAGILTAYTDLEAATVTEASWSGATPYARQAVTLTSSSSGSARTNSARVTFPANSGASAVTVKRVGFWDAATNGNLICFSDTDINTDIPVGVQADFAIGAISISED